RRTLVLSGGASQTAGVPSHGTSAALLWLPHAGPAARAVRRSPGRRGRGNLPEHSEPEAGHATTRSYHPPQWRGGGVAAGDESAADADAGDRGPQRRTA